METNKRCSKCGETKSTIEFGNHKRAKDGLRGQCKQCVRAQDRAFHAANKGRRNAEKLERYHANSHDISIQRKERWRTDAEWRNKYIAQTKAYAKRPESKIAKTNSMRTYLSNPLKRSAATTRNIATGAYRGHYWTSKNATQILGCECGEFRDHINNQLTGNMTTDNYGEVWNIDYIYPLGMCTTLEEIYIYSHYSNTQPLLIEDNYNKGANYIG